MPRLVQSLPPGPLDIIGDVHGELAALRRLLVRLGADPDACTTTRPLVFVGDLIDRGPDSPGVVALVRRLVEAGVAWCVAGNHELNLLLELEKEGNGWFRGDQTDGYQLRATDGSVTHVPFECVAADPADRRRILEFLDTLPLVLQRDDLRVVHACWHPQAMDQLPDDDHVAPLAREWARRLHHELNAQGVLRLEKAERAEFAELRRLDVRPDRPLPAHTVAAAARQSRHPVKVLTSGLEVPVDFDDIFFTGGKWRFVRRHDWWNHYVDGPAVVVGHYWRCRDTVAVDGKRDTWRTDGLASWAGPRGNVFCVDYSVGRRFLERNLGARDVFDGALCALRWPERTLFFDDRDGSVPTTGWGGDGGPGR
jgi:hypothetical protein